MSSGPWYETPWGDISACLYAHADGSYTLRIEDSRWLTADGEAICCAAKRFDSGTDVDLTVEIRAMGYEPIGDRWVPAGFAPWLDPPDWYGMPTEMYTLPVRKPR